MKKLDIIPTNQFKRDLKLANKRGLNIKLLQEIIDLLANKKSLPWKNRDHALHGDFEGYRECHVAPDWLLIYAVDFEHSILVLSRTGTHADLI